MIEDPFVVKAVETIEHEDGSATYTFDIDETSQKGLCNIGLEFVLYCAAHELDLQYVLDNLGSLKCQKTVK